jgi:hypothetical protein
MLIKLTRAGRFHALTMRSNPHKCASMNTKIYHYDVTLNATDKRMTPEGFILNNEHVQSYFDNRWGINAPAWDAVSCELIAITSAKELCELARRDADVWRVTVGIKGSNGAWLNATYSHRGDNTDAQGNPMHEEMSTSR